MLFCRMRVWCRASILAPFRRESSCASSVSNPGARRTRVAERRPPNKAVARMASPWRRILRPSMGSSLLFRCRSQCFAILLAGDRFGVMNLLHRVHTPVGLGQQPLDIGPVLGAEGHAHA